MTDKIQDRLRKSWTFTEANAVKSQQERDEAADHIDALEAENKKMREIAVRHAEKMTSPLNVQFENGKIYQMTTETMARLIKQRDELAAALQKVADADFALSLHKQHDTLSYLKHMAKETLAKLENTND